ncbi:MAG: MFS transporter, partial [Chloroflexi bacterium]|nr:MFS transporter [Chloroflexota bacterium]
MGGKGVFTVIAACLLGNLLLRMSSATAGTLLGLLLTQSDGASLGKGASVLGAAAVAFYASEVIGAPIFGALTDRYSCRPFLLLGCAFGAIAVAGLSMAHVFVALMIVRVLQGLSTASTAPALLSYLSGVTSHSEVLRGRVMAWFELSMLIGIALGGALAGVLFDAFGRLAPLFDVISYVLAAVAFTFVPSKPGVMSSHGVRTQLRLAMQPRVMAFAPAWIAVNAGVGIWFTHLTYQLARPDDPTQLLVGGYTGATIGFYSAGVALLFGAGIGLWSFAFGRLRSIDMMGIALGGLALLCGTLYMLNHAEPGNRLQIGLWLAASMGALLITSGFTPSALAYLAGIAAHERLERG